MLRYILALVACALVYLLFSNINLRVRNVSVGSDKVDRPIRVLHISDLHGRRYSGMTGLVRALRPDICVMTGDMFDDEGKSVDRVIGFVESVALDSPLYYIPGNHEFRLAEFDSIMERLRLRGVRTLSNEIALNDIQGARFAIAGLVESGNAVGKRFHYCPPTDKQLDVLKELDGMGDDTIKLVLCHYPENFALAGDMSYNMHGFDIMFAGHAHGGQVRLPLVGGLYAPGQGALPRYTSGSYGDHPRLEVTRGAGGKWYLPRVFNDPEIVLVTIRPDDKVKGNQMQ